MIIINIFFFIANFFHVLLHVLIYETFFIQSNINHADADLWLEDIV